MLEPGVVYYCLTTARPGTNTGMARSLVGAARIIQYVILVTGRPVPDSGVAGRPVSPVRIPVYLGNMPARHGFR